MAPHLARLQGFPVRAVGLRAFYDIGGPGNDLGIYDDEIKVFVGLKEVSSWRASCDPGRYYIENPLNVNGCAQLQDGLWWFRHGLHQGKYPAFRQHGAFTINRLDRKGKVVMTESGNFGINLHSGGSHIDDVGRASAGCQVVRSDVYFGGPGTQWYEFYHHVKELLQEHGLWRPDGDMRPELPYILTEA